MSKLSYLGAFPFCTPSSAEDGSPIRLWDGETMFEFSPSASSARLVTVCGPGSFYPIGPLTLEEATYLYWGARKWTMVIDYSLVAGGSTMISGSSTTTLTRGFSVAFPGDGYLDTHFRSPDEKDLVCDRGLMVGALSPSGYDDSATTGDGEDFRIASFHWGYMSEVRSNPALISKAINQPTPTNFVKQKEDYWGVFPQLKSYGSLGFTSIAETGYGAEEGEFQYLFSIGGWDLSLPPTVGFITVPCDLSFTVPGASLPTSLSTSVFAHGNLTSGVSISLSSMEDFTYSSGDSSKLESWVRFDFGG